MLLRYNESNSSAVPVEEPEAELGEDGEPIEIEEKP